MLKSWLFIFLTLSSSIYAQDSRTDSLQALIQKGDTHSIIPIDWVHMSRHHLINNNFPRAIQYARKAVALSSGDTNIECKARFYLSNSLENSDPRAALKEVLLNMPMMREFNHPWQYFNARLGASLYRDFGEFPEAIALQQRTVEIAENQNDSFFIMESYTDMGFLYDRMHDYETCLDWQFKAKAIAEEMADTSYASFISGRIGIAYDELEMFDSAHHYNAISLARAEYENDSSYVAQNLSNIGNTFGKQGQWQEALPRFNRAVNLYTALRDSTGVATAAINKGKALMELNRLNEAERLVDRGLKAARVSGSYDFILEAYYRRHELFKERSNIEQSLFWFKKYSDLKDSLFNIEKTKVVADLQTKYETVKKESEINRLATENAEADLRISNQRNWMIAIGLGAILALLAGVLLYIQYKRRKEAELADHELQFKQELINATVVAQEEERQRIAKDLHDGLVQQIAVIKMGFQSLGRKLSPKANDELEYKQKLKMLDEAADEARSLSHQMMPRVLMESGLLAALQDMLNRTLSAHEINFNFEHFGIGEERFANSIEVGLYRIAQELINNIIKHSGAKHVDVQLYKTQTHIIMHIEDDGVGFDMGGKRREKGIGMSNIYSRASAVNGEVNYDPIEGKGTSANIRIPL